MSRASTPISMPTCHQAQGLPVGRSRRVLVEGAAGQRDGGPGRRRRTSPSSAATRSTGRPAGSSRRTAPTPRTARWSATRTPGPTRRSTRSGARHRPGATRGSATSGYGPENALTGTHVQGQLHRPADQGQRRRGQAPAVAQHDSGLAAERRAPRPWRAHTIGYESDEDLDNGYRPAGLIRMSTTTGPTPEYLTDFGNTVVSGHHHPPPHPVPGSQWGPGLLRRHIQWAWGLDSSHDGTDVQPADPRMRQATVNILADMECSPPPCAGPAAATEVDRHHRADHHDHRTDVPPSCAPATWSPSRARPPTPAAASAGVEVSVDGGATWHPADGRGTFSYTGVLSGNGPGAIQVRATDDSGNIQQTPTKLTVNAPCPCSIFGAMQPVNPTTADSGASRSAPGSPPPPTGSSPASGSTRAPATPAPTPAPSTAAGAVLATATFTNETATGWQTRQLQRRCAGHRGHDLRRCLSRPERPLRRRPVLLRLQGHTSGPLTALGGTATRTASSGRRRFPARATSRRTTTSTPSSTLPTPRRWRSPGGPSPVARPRS